MENQVKSFIEKNWDFCIKENKQDKDDLIGVPYPYTVPAVGCFELIYYWDTYFTNIGLFLADRAEIAKYNTDNILFLVEQYGFMPNGNNKKAIDRSQPPFLSMMVRDVYEHFFDLEWLSHAYKVLEAEHQFWMTERITEIGLNKYGNSGYTQTVEHYAEVYKKRIGHSSNETTEELAKQFLATAESGWDISPRFGDRICDFAPVDLNSLMYLFEKNMAFFAKELKNGEEATWFQKAESRKERMNRYLNVGDGFLLDYNFANNTHSHVLSAASYFPLFAGLTERDQVDTVLSYLDKLEATYGVLACEEISDPRIYQWGYPNGWPCLQYVVCSALEQYGYHEDACRIAGKYCSLVEDVFEKTGNLWEKYNVVKGNIEVTNEYEMPPMMGWTAGVYLFMRDFLERQS